MQKSKIRRSFFTKHPKALPSLTSPLPPASPSWSIYLRLSDIKLDRLITCLCDDDLSALIITGTPPPEVLQDAWNDIHDEFTDKMQSEEYEDVKELTKEINLFTTKYNIIRTIVQLLRTMWHMPDMAEALDYWIGYPLELDPTNKVAYELGLEEALGYAARFFSEAESLRMQLPEAPVPGTIKKVTREDFDRELVALSRFNKYKISKYDTTGGEYVAMVQDMRRNAAAIAKATQN